MDIRQRIVVAECFSGCKSMTSGVPQGLVLETFLFFIYIHNMVVTIIGMMSKFANDPKK